MSVKRRLQRTVIRGQEGDDLLDEGSESGDYTITGNMSMSEYKEILKIFRAGQPLCQLIPFKRQNTKLWLVYPRRSSSRSESLSIGTRLYQHEQSTH